MNTGKPKGNVIYYRLYLLEYTNCVSVISTNRNEEFYKGANFVCNNDGEPYYFNTIEEAINQLNEWYEPLQINPTYRKQILHEPIEKILTR